MTTIDHAFDADCPPSALWSVLADLVAVAHYNPIIGTARIRGSRRSGVGAERECDLRPKGRLVERVTDWDDGRGLGIEVVESDWPVRTMRWVTRIDPIPRGSRVTQRLEYRMKFGLAGALLNAVAMKRVLNRNVGATLQAFIRYAEARLNDTTSNDPTGRG